MSAFAFMSIFDVTARLVIVFMLTWVSVDKLKLFAILNLVVGIISLMIYVFYCRRNFVECRNNKFLFDKPQIKSMFGYVGWSLFANMAHISYLQGLNIVLNLFFGVTVNAARGIAVQVQTAVVGFVSNFQMATNPQIIKCYAQKQYDNMFNLVFRSSKFSFYLLFMLCVPLIMYADVVLEIWLKNVPDYAVIFCQLTLVVSLINVISLPFTTVVSAVGKLKINSIVIGSCNLMILPVSYILLRLSYPPQTVFYINIFFYVIDVFLRLFVVRYLTGFHIPDFFRKVLFPILGIVTITVGVCYLLHGHIERNFVGLLLFTLISTAQIGVSVFFIGLNVRERQLITQKIKQFVTNKLRK
jgi:O-antigen/teichoic acid export membrane protein